MATTRRRSVRAALLIYGVLLCVGAMGLAGAAAPGARAATDPYCTEQSVYRDSWCSWYYSRNYYANQACAADPSYGRVGVRFIRLSDGAVLYRYFANDCVGTGVVPASCREAHAANGGTHTWLKLNAAASYNTDC